eukprot:12099287-Alexandrium_andersonii.AAC.1
MSASLVGSEMCIRDSALRSDAGLAPQTFQDCMNLTSSARAAIASSGGRACLLYTSDAADDM